MWTIIKYIWNLPNNCLGWLGSLGGKEQILPGLCDEHPDVHVIRGGWLANIITRVNRRPMALAIGTYIQYPTDEKLKFEDVIAHELVHVQQAAILGPLYLPATVAGYVIAMLGYIFHPRTAHFHDDSPLEVDADARSGDLKFINRNRIVREWLAVPTEKPTSKNDSTTSKRK